MPPVVSMPSVPAASPWVVAGSGAALLTFVTALALPRRAQPQAVKKQATRGRWGSHDSAGSPLLSTIDVGRVA
jgi:hypothetical protein